MKVRKVVNRKIDERRDGVNVAGAVNAAIAAQVDERGAQRVSVSSRQRVVQRGGRTVVDSDVRTADEGEESAR